MVKLGTGCDVHPITDEVRFSDEVDGTREIWAISRQALITLTGIDGEKAFEMNRMAVQEIVRKKIASGAGANRRVSVGDVQ